MNCYVNNPDHRRTKELYLESHREYVKTLVIMQLFFFFFFFLVFFLTDCIPQFRELTTNDCDCETNSVKFECSVMGGTATVTVFQGNALNCGATSNEISLLHSR